MQIDLLFSHRKKKAAPGFPFGAACSAKIKVHPALPLGFAICPFAGDLRQTLLRLVFGCGGFFFGERGEAVIKYRTIFFGQQKTRNHFLKRLHNNFSVNSPNHRHQLPIQTLSSASHDSSSSIRRAEAILSNDSLLGNTLIHLVRFFNSLF